MQRRKWTGCQWSGRRCLQEHLWHLDHLAGTPALAAIGMALGAGSSVCRALVCRDHDIHLFIIYYLSLCQDLLGFKMLCESWLDMWSSKKWEFLIKENTRVANNTLILLSWALALELKLVCSHFGVEHSSYNVLSTLCSIWANICSQIQFPTFDDKKHLHQTLQVQLVGLNEPQETSNISNLKQHLRR